MGGWWCGWGGGWDETHYLVMTVRKQSLLRKGVLKKVCVWGGGGVSGVEGVYVGRCVCGGGGGVGWRVCVWGGGVEVVSIVKQATLLYIIQPG